MALTDGLISLYHFNNNLQDSIGTNHGTAYGAIFTSAAKLGSHAASFDGIDDWISIANEVNFDFEKTDPFSVGSWVYLNNATDKAFVRKGTTLDGSRGWTFLTGNLDNHLYLRIRGDGTTGIAVKSVPTISQNQWVHIAGTYDGSISPSGMQLYINGSVISTTISENNLTGSILNNLNVEFGRLFAGTHQLNGKMDEIAIWNRVVSASEVSQLWNNGNGIEIGAETVMNPFVPRFVKHSNITKAVKK